MENQGEVIIYQMVKDIGIAKNYLKEYKMTYRKKA